MHKERIAGYPPPSGSEVAHPFQAAFRSHMMPPALRAVPCVGLPQLPPHLAHRMEDAEYWPGTSQFVGEPRATVPVPNELFEVASAVGRPQPPTGHSATSRHVLSLPPDLSSRNVGNLGYPHATVTERIRVGRMFAC
jgi:hypothetical protein